MLWQPPFAKGAASPLTGDFRRALQTHIDAIVLRDIDLYALTLGNGDAPCLRLGDGAPVVGRDAILETIQAWFNDTPWSYLPTVMWTFEQERTAVALLEMSKERRALQLLVFQRPHDGWRLVLDHRCES